MTEPNDIVERLRDCSEFDEGYSFRCEAAAEIERLRAERDAAGKLANGMEADVTDLTIEVGELRAELAKARAEIEIWR